MSYSGLISSNCAAQFRYQQASLGTGHGATGILPSAAGRQAGRRQRMRGLSTTGHFYGHSNAHKTLDVVSGCCWCRLCVWVGVCLGKFLNANHIYESFLLLLHPLLSDAKLLIKLYDNLLNQCFPSPPATLPSSCHFPSSHWAHSTASTQWGQ